MKYIATFFSILFGFLFVAVFSTWYQRLIGLADIDIPFAEEGTIEYFEAQWYIIGQDIGPYIWAVFSLVMFSFFLYLRRRFGKKKKDTLNVNDIKGPFVLYLRSFIDDYVTKRRPSKWTDVRTEEEILVEMLSDIAPVYAIGDPKDKKMPLGASRVYVDDEHWKSTVKEMMKRSVLVVLRLGKTDSFWWEVETALKIIPVEKLLFVIPKSKTFDNVSVLYKILLDHNIDIANLNISVEDKHKGSISSFLYFDDTNKVITRDLKISRFTGMFLSYENVLRNTLSDLRMRFGLSPETKRTVRIAKIMEIMILIIMLVTCVLTIFQDLAILKYGG